MHLFYTPDISGNIYTLSEEESRHCQKVLRLKAGDTIHLADGVGTLYLARITDAGGRQVLIEIVDSWKEHGKRPYRVHLAVAPTKNIDRFEWFLEKATEIGIDEVTPLLCEHSERKVIRTDRLEKVITSAMKQSLKAYHPVLHEMATFREFVHERKTGQLFIAHLEEKNPVLLQHVYVNKQDVTILIGPEGDFSPGELAMARTTGFQCISLGDSRLRTETAALVACHTISVLNSV